MTLRTDLETAVAGIFKSPWSTTAATVVPDDNSGIPLGNAGRVLDATVLYADMNDSTFLVDSYPNTFAAEVYKAYLACAARIIRSQGGTITAYDGDRIMAVYVGASKDTNAIKTGLMINWAVLNIVRPKLKTQYPTCSYEPSGIVGIDASELLVAKAGVRGANDLVWIGRAANYAAKLSARKGYPTFITKASYDRAANVAKTNGVPPLNMWVNTGVPLGVQPVYGSTWGWPVV